MPQTRKNKKDIIFKALSWFFVFIWMCLIFFLSSQESNDSAELSRGWLELINKLLGFELSHLLIRKLAHATEYMILGLLFSNALFFTRQKISPILPFCLTALYAISDEIHQYFIPGRACSFKDVLIDCTGAIVGVTLYYALHRVVGVVKMRRVKA